MKKNKIYMMNLFDISLIIIIAHCVTSSQSTRTSDNINNASNQSHPVVVMVGSRNYVAHKQVFNFYVTQDSQLQPIPESEESQKTNITPEPEQSQTTTTTSEPELKFLQRDFSHNFNPGDLFKTMDYLSETIKSIDEKLHPRSTREAPMKRYELYQPTFHSEKETWNNARKICIEEGGHLGIVASEIDEGRFRDMLRIMEVNRAWLGVHDQFREGEWVTVLDEGLYEDVNYVNWDKKIGEPSDAYHKENCMALGLQGMLDVNCDSLESFFCMKPKEILVSAHDAI